MPWFPLATPSTVRRRVGVDSEPWTALGLISAAIAAPMQQRGRIFATCSVQPLPKAVERRALTELDGQTPACRLGLVDAMTRCSRAKASEGCSGPGCLLKYGGQALASHFRWDR